MNEKPTDTLNDRAERYSPVIYLVLALASAFLGGTLLAIMIKARLGPVHVQFGLSLAIAAYFGYRALKSAGC